MRESAEREAENVKKEDDIHLNKLSPNCVKPRYCKARGLASKKQPGN